MNKINQRKLLELSMNDIWLSNMKQTDSLKVTQSLHSFVSTGVILYDAFENG